jgi:hypothetical protein
VARSTVTNLCNGVYAASGAIANVVVAPTRYNNSMRIEERYARIKTPGFNSASPADQKPELW